VSDIQVSTTDCSASEPRHDNENIDKTHDHRYLLYLSSQIFKGVISDVFGFNDFWPHIASDSRNNSADGFVPPMLFNFLTSMTGVSEEVEMETFVPTNEDNERKILSIAHDMVHLSTNGTRVMPKHVALGMTMRHLTGCSNIIGILNRFGHASCHSCVLEHDTALATKQVEKGTIVPELFVKKFLSMQFVTTMILGKKLLCTVDGTTHNANGLLCQKSQPVNNDVQPSRLKQRKHRKQACEYRCTSKC
jgi:hypothetical protein